MSVLVKGIEMPTSCLSCPLQGGTADCRLTQKTYNWGLTERPSDCPLIEVPPHGDLININALKLAIVNVDYVNKHDYLKGVLNAINNAPTVIPADKDGEYDNW